MTALNGDFYEFNGNDEEGVPEDQCALNIREKRKLQNDIMLSPWFSLKHVLQVEGKC